MPNSLFVFLVGVLAFSTLLIRFYISRSIRIIGQMILVFYSIGIFLYDYLLGIELASKPELWGLAFLAWFIVIIFYFFLDIYEDKSLKLCRRKYDLL